MPEMPRSETMPGIRVNAAVPAKVFSQWIGVIFARKCLTIYQFCNVRKVSFFNENEDL
jgi:hypothetical protein